MNRDDLLKILENICTCDTCRQVAVDEILALDSEVCEWKLEDDDLMMFEGSCGITWSFPDGGTPFSNDVKYCPSCGKKCNPLPTPPES